MATRHLTRPGHGVFVINPMPLTLAGCGCVIFLAALVGRKPE
jgi:hypothetical protein